MKRKKASAIIDYSLLMIAVAMVLVVMGIYLERGIAGSLKSGVDVFSHGRQYQGDFIRP